MVREASQPLNFLCDICDAEYTGLDAEDSAKTCEAKGEIYKFQVEEKVWLHDNCKYPHPIIIMERFRARDRHYSAYTAKNPHLKVQLVAYLELTITQYENINSKQVAQRPRSGMNFDGSFNGTYEGGYHLPIIVGVTKNYGQY